MDIESLKHNPEAVFSCIKLVDNGNDDKSVVAVKPCKIVFPKYWMETDFCSIDSHFNVLAFVGILDENDNYGSFQGVTKFSLNPYDVSVIKIDDVDYYALSYTEGQVITESILTVKDTINSYAMYNEFHEKAKTPFYMSYPDVVVSFATANFHAGFKANTDLAVLSILVANRARDPRNNATLFRYTLKTQDDVMKKRPAYIPLMSVSGATSTSTRLMGNYQNDGLVESMLSPTTILDTNDKIHFI